jgi:hypothetical protein
MNGTTSTNQYQNEYARKAQQLLRFYFRRLFTATGANWDADSAGDIESIVPALISALDERVDQAITKALVTTNGKKVSRVLIGQSIILLADIQRIRKNTQSEGYLITIAGGRTEQVDKNAGARLWELLREDSVNLNTPIPETIAE